MSQDPATEPAGAPTEAQPAAEPVLPSAADAGEVLAEALAAQPNPALDAAPVTPTPAEPDPFATADLEDGVYIPDDESQPPPSRLTASNDDAPELKSTGVEPIISPEAATPGSVTPSAQDGFLEEQVETLEHHSESLKLERGEYTVTGFDPVGRKLARAPDGSEVVIAAYPGGAAVTQALYPHPMLPPLLDAGVEDGRTLIAHPRLSGTTLEQSLQEQNKRASVGAILDLARFNRYLAARGFALTGLEPREVLLGPTRLARLPNVRKIGDSAEAEAPRYGAPERASGTDIGGLEGVYTLGAMLYHALEGRALVEGELPSAFPEIPGAPQALSAMLAPTTQRASPQEALELVSKLDAALQPRHAWLLGSSSSVGINPDRSINEDSCGAVLRCVRSDTGNDLNLVACVADGMGGMAKGEDASQAAVAGFLEFKQHEFSQATVLEAAQAANARVIEVLEGKSGGCTFTGIIAEAERVIVAHVGDTRAYLISDQLVEQITEDHSMVMMLVKMGVITPEAAHNHPDSNKVMRAMGSNRVLPPDYVETHEISMRPGSRLVLMSDGVWGALLPADLERMLLASQTPQDMADALVRAALKAGSSDNATAMVLFYEERDAL